MAERGKTWANVTEDSREQPIEDPHARDKNKTGGVSSTVSISGGSVSGENVNLGTQQGGVTFNKDAKKNTSVLGWTNSK